MILEKILKELNFKATRSSGPGGQHVNKTASKVDLSINIKESIAFSETEKKLLFQNLKTKLSLDGILQLSCSETRSQHRNKAMVIDRLLDLLTKNIKEIKPRKRTKPTKKAIEKRLKNKKDQALKKSNRKPPPQQ